jgi:hypothetical protein
MITLDEAVGDQASHQRGSDSAFRGSRVRYADPSD